MAAPSGASRPPGRSNLHRMVARLRLACLGRKDHPVTNSEIRAFLAASGQRTIGFRPCFVPLCGGSINAALMLSQALYWSAMKEADGGWFWKTREEWLAETCLTRTEQETARAKLRQTGFWEEKRVGLPPRLHFRIDVERMLEALASQLRQEPATEKAGTLPQSGGNPADIKDTEITSKTTTEKLASVSLSETSASPAGCEENLPSMRFPKPERGSKKKERGRRIGFRPPEAPTPPPADRATAGRTVPELAAVEAYRVARTRFRTVAHRALGSLRGSTAERWLEACSQYGADTILTACSLWAEDVAGRADRMHYPLALFVREVDDWVQDARAPTETDGEYAKLEPDYPKLKPDEERSSGAKEAAGRTASPTQRRG
jgi:hypothetical protein